jgi:hypothetical protein
MENIYTVDANLLDDDKFGNTEDWWCGQLNNEDR